MNREFFAGSNPAARTSLRFDRREKRGCRAGAQGAQAGWFDNGQTGYLSRRNNVKADGSAIAKRMCNSTAFSRWPSPVSKAFAVESISFGQNSSSSHPAVRRTHSVRALTRQEPLNFTCASVTVRHFIRKIAED